MAPMDSNEIEKGNPEYSAHSDPASEDAKDISDVELAEIRTVKQGLHQRHIQMIALAGTIGTGLFLGSGRNLSESGPLGALLGYTIVGVAVSPVVMGVGEMGALIPLSGGVIRYVEYFVDPALAFADGWNLVYAHLVGIPAEIVAASVLVQFWVQVNNAVWITVFGVLMLITGISFVRIYGELEFFFSLLKILLIVGINLMALVITCGGGQNHEPIGFRYWHHPGPFVQYLGVSGPWGRFLGFWAMLATAPYAYAGIEFITVAAAETRNPRTAIPQAARRVFWRILLFYVITIFMIGLIVPSNDPALTAKGAKATAKSPFVIAATRAGAKAVPSIVNTVVISSAWSAGNSALLSGSRILFGLAQHGHAPRVFLRLNRFGVPWVGVALIGVFMALGFMSLDSTAYEVFTWLQDLISIATLVNWIIISITYLRFFYGCRAQGVNRQLELPWAAPFQPYSTWVSLCLFIVLLLTGGFTVFMKGHWNVQTFIGKYLEIPVIILLFFGYKFLKKTRIEPLTELPIRRFITLYQQEPVPEVKKKRGLQKLNVLWG
ncbi:hypothetical protein K461DRAFT_283808 [Myriangium duriaei CBS 260.36]|uniref:Amino acid permease/ SLC12A domain-containing protein n=1 Tax=Myriangium duriaei CBS 260.36 TaxID=1168546 RepID=A0A9P4J8J2_9PEZI|nr:hypothetical protein K461DRAFT_283808 [Myriangium duriaei CBS 260.36]